MVSKKIFFSWNCISGSFELFPYSKIDFWPGAAEPGGPGPLELEIYRVKISKTTKNLILLITRASPG